MAATPPQATPTGYRHIVVDDQGRPIVAGTGVKVAPLIGQIKAWGWSAEAAQRHHPQLSRAQIYSALAYYHDHRAEIDAEIEGYRREYDAGRSAKQAAPSRAELEARRAAVARP